MKIGNFMDSLKRNELKNLVCCARREGRKKRKKERKKRKKEKKRKKRK